MSHTAGLFNYVYNYTDHLGNIRVSYTKNQATGTAKIMEENHYYPFGLKHTSYNEDRLAFKKEENEIVLMAIPSVSNRPFNYNYKYNGKELQNELLFTIPMEDFDKIKGNPNFSIIGHMTQESEGIHLITRANTKIPLKARGWDALEE